MVEPSSNEVFSTATVLSHPLFARAPIVNNVGRGRPPGTVSLATKRRKTQRKKLISVSQRKLSQAEKVLLLQDQMDEIANHVLASARAARTNDFDAMTSYLLEAAKVLAAERSARYL